MVARESVWDSGRSVPCTYVCLGSSLFQLSCSLVANRRDLCVENAEAQKVEDWRTDACTCRRGLASEKPGHSTNAAEWGRGGTWGGGAEGAAGRGNSGLGPLRGPWGKMPPLGESVEAGVRAWAVPSLATMFPMLYLCGVGGDRGWRVGKWGVCNAQLSDGTPRQTQASEPDGPRSQS